MRDVVERDGERRASGCEETHGEAADREPPNLAPGPAHHHTSIRHPIIRDDPSPNAIHDGSGSCGRNFAIHNSQFCAKVRAVSHAVGRFETTLRSVEDAQMTTSTMGEAAQDPAYQHEAMLAHLPRELRAQLMLFCADLHEALGRELVAVALYGSAARGDWDAVSSDVNVLVVLHSAKVPQLKAIIEPLDVAQRSGAIRPMVVTKRDLERSSDVFPLRFLEMQRTHVLLWGEEDPLDAVDIAWDELRLDVEQAIKNLLWKLRQRYLLDAHRPERLGAALVKGIDAFLVSMGALMFLEDGQWWVSGKEKIAQAMVRELEVDPQLIEKLEALRRGQLEPTPEQTRTLYDHFLRLVELAADRADAMQRQETP
jgi:predicted nucleotidyltransferase